MRPDLEYIRKTADLIKDYVVKTPIVKSLYLSRVLNAEVYLKLENLQVTGSFKARGAFSKIIRNLDKARSNGVIAASTGNHGQAVAYASTTLGAKATIVMPKTAPQLKINRIRRFGGDVLLHGEIFDEAARLAVELAEKENKVFVHPFDDPDIIAGQGTIGLEMAEIDPDVVVVPIGGGGLISGISIALKSLKPNVKVIGVQSKEFPYAYIKRHELRGLKVDVKPEKFRRFILPDGIAVKKPGEITSKIIAEYVDEVHLVDDHELLSAIYTLLKRDKITAEGAGAASVALALSGKIDLEGKRVILLISGGNIDPPALLETIFYGLSLDERLFYLRARGPDGIEDIILQHALLIDSNVKKLPVEGEEFSGYIAVSSKDDFEKLVNELKERGYTVF